MQFLQQVLDNAMHEGAEILIEFVVDTHEEALEIIQRYAAIFNRGYEPFDQKLDGFEGYHLEESDEEPVMVAVFLALM